MEFPESSDLYHVIIVPPDHFVIDSVAIETLNLLIMSSGMTAVLHSSKPNQTHLNKLIKVLKIRLLESYTQVSFIRVGVTQTSLDL